MNKNKYAYRIKAEDYWHLVFKYQYADNGIDAAEKKANDDQVPMLEIAKMLEWAMGYGTPLPPPLQSKNKEGEALIKELEKPITRSAPQLPDEQVLGYLRGMLERFHEMYADPKELCREFRKDRRKAYPNQLHLIEQVLLENGLQYPKDEPPSEPVVETLPVEIPEPDDPVKTIIEAPAKKKRKPPEQLYGNRQNNKEIGKALIVNFLNADRNRRRKGYKISTIYYTVTWIHKIDERTARRYLDELYKEGKVKRWAEPVILEGGQKVYHHWYASTSMPDEKYHLWVDKRKCKKT